MRRDEPDVRMARHDAVEDQVADGHGRVQRVADHVVEVVVGQPGTFREADRMQEDHRTERVGAGEEGFQPEPGIGQVEPVDVGVDLDAAQAERADRVVELLDRELGVLQRHRAEPDEAPRRGRHQRRDAFVHLAGQDCPALRRREIEELERRRADRLDVDAHAVHVVQPLVDAGQLRRTLPHLRHVGLAREGICMDHARVVAADIEVARRLGDLRVQVVAVDVDDRRTVAAHRRRRAGRARHRKRSRSRAARGRRGVAVGQVGAVGEQV